MNEPWVLALIQNIPAMIAAVASAVGVWVSLRNSQQIKSVHKDINSRMDEALVLKGRASHAQGMLDEKNAAAVIAKADAAK